MLDQNIHRVKINPQPNQGKRRTLNVIQLNMKNEILNEFNSIAEAAKVTGCNQAHIVQVCKGNELHTKGYKWKYA